MLEKETKVNESGWKDFSSLLENLPLENCTRECNPVTKEWGWKAPKNKAFRISGHFVIDSDQANIEDHYMPLESVDMLKEKHPKKYAEFLAESEGDESEALDLLVDDVFNGSYLSTPMIFFDGKWLVISPDLKQELDKNEKSGLETPKLMVKSDVEAWLDREYLQTIDDIAPQSSTITEVLFESQVLAKHWKQYYAEAVLGKCKIDLIDFPESGKEEGFYIPETKDDKHLYLPEGTRKTGVFSKNEFAIRTEVRTGDEEKKQIKDFARDIGLTFGESLNSNLLVARRSNELIQSSTLIIPKKKRKRSQDIPF